MKRNNVFIMIAFVLGNWATGYSQVYNNFDLSSFVTPDIVRNQLDFSLNSSGSIKDQRATSGDWATINADLGSNFSRYKNTRAYLGSQQVEFKFNGQFSNNKTNEEKKKAHEVKLSYQTSNRFYQSNKFFYEIGGFAYINHSKQEDPTYQRWNAAQATLVAGVGKGRIEPVTDARQAIYILENLSKKGVLDRKLSDDEILSLSSLIAVVKNKRFFDARLRMIDEITAVDSFFVKNKLLKSSGASYFTTLYDYWMYGDRFERSAGLELYAGLVGGYGHSFLKSRQPEAINSSTFKNNEPSIGAQVSMTYEKPVNMYWQQSARIGLFGDYRIRKYTDSSQIDDMNDTNASLQGYYYWGYYPTSRTNLNVGVREVLSWNGQKDRDTDDSLYSYWRSSTYAFLKAYYYLSPQLRLTAEVDGGLDYQNKPVYRDFGSNDYELGWNGSFLLTLTYSLF